MPLSVTPIRVAIEEVLEGTIGSTRTLTAGDVDKGAREGDALTNRQTNSLVNPRYSVRLMGFSRHDGTAVGAIGSYRLDEVAVVVRLTYHLPASIQETQRDAAYDGIVELGDKVWQALSFPRNLAETSGAVSTNIVSGCLIGPHSFAITQEDWPNRLLVAELSAQAIVQITQAVA